MLRTTVVSPKYIISRVRASLKYAQSIHAAKTMHIKEYTRITLYFLLSLGTLMLLVHVTYPQGSDWGHIKRIPLTSLLYLPGMPVLR